MASTVLITGASSGIGRATAQLFQDRGWNVAATMRAPERETDRDAGLQDLDRVLVDRLDVTDAGSIRAAVARAIDRFGRIDVLVNNAGFGAYGVLEATPDETIERQFAVNVLGPLQVIKALVPHFRANRAGAIVNVSSMGGRVAMPLGALYHGSKFALEGITEALRFEMAAIGVRVRLVEPGMVRTDFASRSLSFSNDERLAEYQVVVGRTLAAFAAAGDAAAKPEAVAEVIFRASTDGSDQLRHVAGADAKALLARRQAESDATFLPGIAQQFGL